jgi:hypothetical protein
MSLAFLVVTAFLAKLCVADCHRHPAASSPYKGLNVTYKKVCITGDLLQTRFLTFTHLRVISVKQHQVSNHSLAMYIFQHLS